jgi:hypothetical protein
MSGAIQIGLHSTTYEGPRMSEPNPQYQQRHPGWQQQKPRKPSWFAENPGKTVALGILGGLFAIGSIANAADSDEPTETSPTNFEDIDQRTGGGFEVDKNRSDGERGRGEGNSQDDRRPPPTGNGFVMPETTGMDLQLAQDTLQSVSGNPLFYSDSIDASGDGRGQWLDSGWQVCWSEPAAGEIVQQFETPTFAVVRVSENCP